VGNKYPEQVSSWLKNIHQFLSLLIDIRRYFPVYSPSMVIFFEIKEVDVTIPLVKNVPFPFHEIMEHTR